MRISIFNGLPKKGEKHISNETIELSEFLSQVKYGIWKETIEQIRQEKEKKDRDLLKKKLPSVTISGVFSERKESLLIEHSGFICIDIDNFKDKSPLIEDPYTYSLFKSSSGGGLAVIVKINPLKHKESFKWLQNYYFQEYGIVVDPAPQNPASLRYVSYDPDIIINEKSKKSGIKTLKEKKKKSIPVVIPSDKVGEYIQEIVDNRIDIAPDYEIYRDLGFAIADGFGEQGRDYFYALCSVSSKYDSRHAKKQYDECLKGRKIGITVGTFYWMLKEAGIDISVENKRLIQIATLGKEAKRKKEDVVKQLVELEDCNEKQAIELVDEVFSRKDIDIKKSIDTPAELIFSLMSWMSMNHPLKKNEITGIIEDGETILTKERINYIYLRARIFFDSKDITKDLIESVIHSEFTKNYNPITDYIERNQNRKSEGNIDNMIKTLRLDKKDDQSRMFVRKWLISIIAAYNYYPVRSVLSIIGPQHCGKTEWFRRLLPKDLQTYFGESKLDSGKDDELLMCQKLILIDDEMGGKSKQDEKKFKELTSKSIFSLRAPYERHNKDYQRLALLGGSSNEDGILSDPTGNTRMLPVKIKTIDHELYNSIDKDELFMELYRAYEDGEEWQLSKEELKSLNDFSANFEQIPFERELIERFFEHPNNVNSQQTSKPLTSIEIKEFIEESSNQKIVNLRRFQSECTKFFGPSKIISIKNYKKRVYKVTIKRGIDPIERLGF